MLVTIQIDQLKIRKNLLTPKEVAEILQVPVSTVKFWTYRPEYKNRLKPVKVGKHLRIIPQELLRFLAQEQGEGYPIAA